MKNLKKYLAVPESFAAQVLSRYVVSADGCWLYMGEKRNGYARASFAEDGHTVSIAVHVLACIHAGGPFTEGLQVDHTCHDPVVCRLGDNCPHRGCINPAHLEVVTPRENTARSSAWLVNKEKTTCPHGHEHDGMRNNRGERICRTCNRDQGRRAWQARVADRPSKQLRTHCLRGHPYDAVRRGHSACKTCLREAEARRRARNRAKRAGA